MDPTRLMDENGDDFERQLLGVARNDEPPAGAIARGAVVLGLAATSVSITTTTAGTASAAGAKVSGTVFGTAALAKWVGIGAAVGIVTTSGVRIMSDPDVVSRFVARSTPATVTPTNGTRAQSAPGRPVSPVAAPAPESAPPEATIATPGPFAVPAPPAPVTSTKSRATSVQPDPGAVSAAPEPAPPSLAAEVDALERARRALLQHQPNDALLALDAYSAARKTSVLAAEAQLLRIEALLQLGKREAAVRLAEKALEQSPNGSHAARLREIVAAK